MSTQKARPLPNFFLGKVAANERITQFRNSKHPLLNQALGRTDTQSIWYSLQHFENIYKELVYLNADGLRIYFGEYDAAHPDFPGQLCLIMVPTRCNVETLGSEDVILEDENDFPDRPGSEMFLNNEPSKGYNYGSPCPSVCPLQGSLKYPY